MAPDTSKSRLTSNIQSQSEMLCQRPDGKKATEDYDTLLANLLPMVERELGREVKVEDLEKLIKMMMGQNDSEKPVTTDRNSEHLDSKARIPSLETERRRDKASLHPKGRYHTMDLDWLFSDGPESSTKGLATDKTRNTHQTNSEPTMTSTPSGIEQSPSSPIVSCPTNHGIIKTFISDSYNIRATKDSARKSSRRSTHG